MGFLSKLFGNKEEKVEELVLKAYMKGKVQKYLIQYLLKK